MGAEQSTNAEKVMQLSKEGRSVQEIADELHLGFNDIQYIRSVLIKDGKLEGGEVKVHRDADNYDQALILYARGESAKQVSEALGLTIHQARYIRRNLISEGRLQARWKKNPKLPTTTSTTASTAPSSPVSASDVQSEKSADPCLEP
jgi:DNA-binding CsgD family transcriptional regulator